MLVRVREKYMAIKFRLKGLKMDPFRIAKMLGKSQFWSRTEIENYQLNLIRLLYSNAKSNVDYYKSNGYAKINSVKSLENFLDNFPVLSKKKITENRLSLKGNGDSKSFVHSTSGSTGMPMTYLVSNKAESFRIASNLRFFSWWGLNMYDRNVLIWRKNGNSQNQVARYLKAVENKFLGKMVLDVFKLNDSTIFDYYKAINRHKPKYIRGYKSGVYELARLMEKHNLRFEGFKLRLAVVTSETMYNFERALMEEIFQCKVANEYGSAEAGLFALECPSGAMHINEESVLIQTDSDNYTYVTELHNDSMPLINYKNEDRIILKNEKCSCGRTLKIIDSVDGRISDYIELPNGNRIHSFVIPRCIAEINKSESGSIKKFKTIQKNRNLEIRIILENGSDISLLSDLENRLREKIGFELNLKILNVENIEREKSGKQRSFIRLS